MDEAPRKHTGLMQAVDALLEEATHRTWLRIETPAEVSRRLEMEQMNALPPTLPTRRARRFFGTVLPVLVIFISLLVLVIRFTW